MRPILLGLIVGILIYGLAIGTTYPLLGVVLADQVDSFRNGLNAAGTGVGLMLGVLLTGPCVRRVGAGRTILLGVVVMAGSLVAMALTQDYWPVLAARMALGIGANFMFVVCETALNSLCRPEQRGRVLGWYTAANAVGFALGPAAVALFADRPVLLLGGCAAATLLALIPFGPAAPEIDRRVSPPTLGGWRALLVAAPGAFLLVAVASMVDAIMISLLPVIAIERGEGAARGALLASVFHIGLIAAQPVVGWALDRHGRRVTLALCVALSALGAVAMAAPWGAHPIAALALMAVWGGTNYALYTGALTLIGDRFDGASLTGAVALFAGVYALASTVAPGLAGGALALLGAEGLYLALAFFYLVAGAVALPRIAARRTQTVGSKPSG
ncbi:MAG: MFS transporter [Alphaproteobacteria bacterium]|nr:MFS transporter [Alphaproteobacteria bacterium]